MAALQRRIFMNNKVKGILFITIATIIYGLSPVVIRMTFDEGSNAATTTFLRFAIAVPVLFIICLWKKIPLKITPAEFGYLFLAGGVCISGVTLLLNYSYNYISVGISATLHFIYPILVSLACVVLFKDRLDKWKILALVLGTIGIVAFLEKGQAAWAGIVLALLSGVVYALYIIIMDKTPLKHMSYFKATFYMCLTGMLTALVAAAVTNSLTLHAITPKGWLLSILFSILSTVVALTLFQIGVACIGAAAAAIMSTVEPITSVICGILILGETITAAKIIGCALIIGSILLISRSPAAPE